MGLSWLMWMRKREVASKPHIHSSGFSHCQAGVRSLRGVTSRKGSPETIIWGHLHLCCLGRLSTYQSLRNWHITPVFLFLFLLFCFPYTLHLAQHNPPDNSTKFFFSLYFRSFVSLIQWLDVGYGNGFSWFDGIFQSINHCFRHDAKR